jgi:hypothetical protein
VRGRVIVLLGVLVAGGVIGASPSGAQTAPPSDSQAYGGLIEGGARVEASHNEFGSSNGTAPTSRGNGDVTCTRLGGSGPTSSSNAVSMDQIRSDFEAAQAATGASSIRVELTCYNSATGRTSFTSFNYPAGNGPVVPPAVIAAEANKDLYFPAPDGQMSPSMEAGSVAQLPAYFFMFPWVWEPLTAQAAAGPVVATATATPLSQRWEIVDAYRDDTYVVECEWRGVSYEEVTAGSAEQPCTWTPPHSSAGQPVPRGGGTACFYATVTMTWQVDWSSTIGDAAGPGGSFDPQSRTASTCIVVKEVQAVVSGDGSG